MFEKYDELPIEATLRREFPEGTKFRNPRSLNNNYCIIKGEIRFNPNNCCYCCCGCAVYNLLTGEKATIVLD